MRIFYIIALLALVFGNAAQTNAQVDQKANQNQVSKMKSKLRFDGFYCEPNNDGRICLRFYAEGLVLAVSLGDIVTDEDLVTAVPEWFHRDSDKGISKGTFKVSKNEITFTESVVYNDPNEEREVTVDYDGKIKNSGKLLVLDTYSHYNGYRQNGRRFKFIKITP